MAALFQRSPLRFIINEPFREVINLLPWSVGYARIFFLFLKNE